MNKVLILIAGAAIYAAGYYLTQQPAQAYTVHKYAQTMITPAHKPSPPLNAHQIAECKGRILTNKNFKRTGSVQRIPVADFCNNLERE